MFRLYILAFFIVFILSDSTAQIIYEHSDTSRFRFSYAPFEKSVNNKVLNQLALAHLKIPEKTSFDYLFRYRVSINYSQNDSLYVLMDVKSLQVNGDKIIRDFDIQRLLQPSSFNISLLISDPNADSILFRAKDVIMDDGIVTIASFPDSLWRDGLQVNLNIHSISFTEPDYRRLELELTAIRDYYASASLSDTLLKRVQKARRNTNSLNEVVKTYVSGIKGLYLLEQSVDVPSQIVPGSDPLKTSKRINILKYNVDEYISHIISSQKILMVGNVYKTFADAYIESLKEANKLSQQVDYYSSPFFYKLYANSITSSQLYYLEKLFRKELKRRKTGVLDAKILTHYILVGYMKESQRLIKEDRYLEAVDLLTGAVKLKNLSPYDQLSEEIESALAEARKGLVFSYTQIIQKSLDKNLLSLAEKYLAEVEKYIVKYNMSNTETSPFRELYIRMAGIYLQVGNNSLQKPDYYTALNDFTKSLELLNGYESIVKNRALDGQLIAVRAIYNNNISVVEKHISDGNIEEAEFKLRVNEEFASQYLQFYPDKTYVHELRSQIASLKFKNIIHKVNNDYPRLVNEETISALIDAIELANQYNLTNKVLADTLSYRIGLPYLTELLQRGKLKYYASEPDSAIFIANKAMTLASRLELNNDFRISNKYNELIEMSKETFCSQSKGEYLSKINQAEEFFKQNKLTLGIEKANEAREFAYLKATCGLNTAPVNALTEKYKHQIRWSNLVTQAFKLLEENKFIESADLIQQAESIYSYYKLESVGLANIGYYDLAMKSDNSQMIKHAITYMLNRSGADHALTLLERLREAGCTTVDSETVQESVARTIAIRDKAEIPDLNVNLMLRTYTKENEWYAKFRNVYLYYTRSSDSRIDRSIEKISTGIKNIF
jgi:hypothetical protein